jgi:hypothetical protein
MQYGRFFGTMSLFLLASSSALAGVVVTATSTKLDTRQASPMTVYVDADRLKVVSPEATVIFRGDTNRMWVIMPEQRSYMEMTAETMQQMGGQLAGAQAQLGAAQAALQAQLAQMPPQQRAMMEQMLAGRGLGVGGPPGAGASAPPQISFAKAGGSKTVGSWNCDNYSKTVNGQKEEDLCIAPVSATGITPADLQVFEKFSSFIQPISSSPMVPKTDYMSWNDMNKAIGFAGVPLDTTMYIQGRPNIQHTVNKIERTAIPATTYDLPAGFTKREMPGMPR